MQYLGGKSRLGRTIVQAIEPWRQSGDLFVDAFCGALNVVRHASGHRLALDLCLPLVTMWQAVQGGWQPPEHITAEQWAWIKANPDPWDPLTAFALFGCSYGGQWGSSYAYLPGKYEPRYQRASVLRKLQDCRDLEILCRDYRQIPEPNRGIVLYCDIPYEGSAQYAGVAPFTHSEFWDYAEWWTRCGARVFVSEGIKANPPPGWLIYRQWGVQATLKAKKSTPRIERLYVHRSSLMGWNLV